MNTNINPTPVGQSYSVRVPKDDFDLVETDKLLNLVGDWRSYLLQAQSYSIEELESHERTGRPLGDERFIEVAELILERDLRKKKPGPKAKNDN